jgi:hypothetical protein
VVEIGMGVSDETLTTGEWIGMTTVLFIGAFLAVLLSFVLAMVFLFGFIGVIYLFMAGLAPLLLRWIRRITMRGHLKARTLGWLLLIPEHLDTGTLQVKAVKPEDEFPWGRFQRAFLWQVFFGLMIAVYVSLNPFFLRGAEIEELFNLMSNGFAIVSILVLPWFITLRLDARIEGPVRDFKVYEGIRSRMLRTFLAIGTIMIFLRFALEDLSPEKLLVNFAQYTIIIVLFTLLITYIYFNFFENDLAAKVVERLPWMEEDESEEPEAESSAEIDTKNDSSD